MRTLPWPLFAAMGALLLLIGMNATGVAVWDDAYIFWRYASHIVSEGRWNWNPEDGPSYGVTSVAWTALLALPSQIIDAPLGLWLASLLCGMAVLILLWKLSRASRWMLAWILLANAVPLSIHFTSGMDTALVILYQLIWLSMVDRRAPSSLLGLMAGLGWWVRPEVAGMLMLSLAIHSMIEKNYVGILISIGSLAVAILICILALGSAIPLPMFSKAGAHEEPVIRALYALDGWGYGLLFFVAQLPVFGSLVNRKALRSTIHLWLPALALCLFYMVGVTHIMGMQQRFYYHAWPLLAMAGFHSMRDAEIPSMRGILILIHGGCILLLTLVFNQRPSSMLARWGVFDLEEVYRLQGGEYNWPLLPQVQQLPKEAAIATTELGMAGAWDLQRPVIDLSSLTDPAQLSPSELAVKVVTQQQPEVIWLHPHYALQTNAFLSLPEFQRNYTWFSPESTGAYQGLALRNASPHFEFLRKEVERYIALHP